MSGCSADRDLTFVIAGRGQVELSIKFSQQDRKITLKNALHTPNLWSNLISVSKLVSKGAQVQFACNVAVVTDGGGKTIFTAAKNGQLYTVPTIDLILSALTVQSKCKATTFNTWHRQLGHAGIDTIR